MKRIRLTQGQFALVDDNDFDWLSQRKWFAAWCTNTGSFYACRNIPKGTSQTRLSMHAAIMVRANGCPNKTIIDHINHDTLDNRRSNLRACGNTGNCWNKRKPKNNTSGFKGVHFRESSGRYRAYIKLDYKQISLGHYDTALEAARAYDRAACENFGEFALLNFPKDHPCSRSM